MKYTVPIEGIGLVAGCAGFALLIRELRKSSAFYRPRGFFWHDYGTADGRALDLKIIVHDPLRANFMLPTTPLI